ncbi:hypothetical protein J1777_08225 [Comamonas denitrificans]|uniref:Uncharacterized protein n=1 Tax=Comamonas denitrificans TaxID=117506 RepID=A0A939GX89_9BURK|nr:hypothetical protein [Comamonas denitrificans]MBO1249804.1 hypothetical protein [Comamonas denitrificans]
MQPSETMRQVSFAPLLRASEGLTQWRPMALGFLTWVVVALLLAVGGFLSSSLGGAAGVGLMGLFGLLAMILIAAGMSGAGILLMDKAKNIAPRSMMDAFLAGLWCIPKFLGFYVVVALVLVALAVVGAIGYFLAKIPGIGPLFFFVLHPVLVIVAAAVLTSLLWVGFPLFTPAVWEGRGFKESLSLVIAVSRQRLVPTVLLFLALYVVVSVIGMVVFGALLPGYFFMSGLATSILGVGMTGNGLAAITALMNGYGGGSSGLMYAGILATALIFGLAFTLMMQVALMGVNLVYLSATDGLDTADTENALNAGLDEMKRRAREAQEKARLAAEQAQEKARQMAEEAKERARQRAAEQAAAQAAAAEQTAAQAQAAAVLAAEQAEQQAAADRSATEAAAAQAAPPDAAPQEPPLLAKPAPSTDLPPASAATATCPQCQHTVGHDDMFCGECGHRLKS